jgi:lipopolysaccharide transport system permease protein
VRYALPFIIQIWFFLTPIIYPSSLVPDQLRTLLAINPMTGIIEGFRDALFGREFDWIALLTATCVIFFVLFYSSYRFRRLERSFAEFI